MSLSDVSYDELRNLAIGTVESVSPAEIRVMLDINAPQNTSLNTGEPTLFPKINGYVLIPNEAGALVCIISWMGIEHSSFPKRQGFKDFDLIDLPFPLRKLTVNPLGIIKKELDDRYKIERGVYSYPSVGDVVIIPTRKQLESIVENKDKNACIKIGISPLAANAPVFVDPDKLFGRHIAVLGNTGSGKSCSVAGLIRWSLEAAQSKIETYKKEDVLKATINIDKPNARFIVLDPNGEYSNAFNDFTPRKYKVTLGAAEQGWQQLKVPAWMWNSYEWSSITQASSKTQRPLLRQTLRAMRNSLTQMETVESEIKRFLGTLLVTLRAEKNNGNPWGNFPKPKVFYEKLKKWSESTDIYMNKIGASSAKDGLEVLSNEFKVKIQARSGQYPTYDFSVPEIDGIIAKLNSAYILFGGSESELMPISEDSPVPFDSVTFLTYFKALADDHDAAQYVDYLLMRIRTILNDARMSSVIGTDGGIVLCDWLENYIGNNNSINGQLTIIDLSIVPSDIIHIVVSVISRIIFESLQRYRRQNNEVLPTVIVMEEAHNFISRYNSESEEITPSKMCSQTFEKIAKEGRKFGLGLVLSSQRPSELSATVLSQCNTFLLHRLVNDKDQEMVGKLVPDNLGKILNELPTLPTRKAILLGWAAPVPILVEMNELPKEHRPHSEDPDFWDVWTGKEERKIDWSTIVSEWQKDDTKE